MRTIGNRGSRPIGLFGPTDDEIRPKGVYRYRTHAEANAAADRWAVEAMVKRALELRSAPREVSRVRAAIGRLFSRK